MINVEKLKYYKELKELGIVNSEEFENIDDAIAFLEEKQFELLQRIESTKDKDRKIELQGADATIEEQLSELSTIQEALQSGIIADTKKPNNVTEETKVKKSGKKKIIIGAIIAIICIAGAALIISNMSDEEQATTTNENAAEETLVTDDTSSDEDAATLGFSIFSVFKDTQEELGTDIEQGVYILEPLTKEMEEAVEPGDRIVSLNGVIIDTEEKLFEEKEKYKPGEPFVLVIRRDGEDKTINGTFKSYNDVKDPTLTGEKKLKIDGINYFIDLDTCQLGLD